MFTLEKLPDSFPDTLLADAATAITARSGCLKAEGPVALIWVRLTSRWATITVAAPGAARMQFSEAPLKRDQGHGFTESEPADV